MRVAPVVSGNLLAGCAAYFIEIVFGDDVTATTIRTYTRAIAFAKSRRPVGAMRMRDMVARLVNDECDAFADALLAQRAVDLRIGIVMIIILAHDGCSFE